jgi:hypothetical protein
MANLTAPRSTPVRMDNKYLQRRSAGCAASLTFMTGSLAMYNAAGFLTNVAAATLKPGGIVGPQPSKVPSTSYTSTAVAGETELEIQPVTAKMDNDGADPLLVADIDGPCYYTDDHTVCKTSTGKSVVGRVVGLDDATSPTGAGVWVAIGEVALGDGLP